VPAQTIDYECHAHVGCNEVLSGITGDRANRKGELHCIEATGDRYAPPRVFGAVIDWDSFCAGIGGDGGATPPEASGAGLALVNSGNYDLHQYEAEYRAGLGLSGGAKESVRVSFNIGGDACSCCKGPLTGKTPTEGSSWIDCSRKPDQCVTFMLCGNLAADPARVIGDAGRRALCAAWKSSDEHERHPVAKDCKWLNQNWCYGRDGKYYQQTSGDRSECFQNPRGAAEGSQR
jgi:hypothetical protein